MFEVLSITSLLFSFLSFVVSAYTLIEVKAMQKSTHRFAWLHPDQINEPIVSLTDAEKKKLQEDPFGNIM